MKLIIREYLETLKERHELDAFLPDLLLSMSIQPIVRPQTGVPQYGVDLLAHGKDPADKQDKVFLFVIKGGDIDRSSWNAPDQGVKDSLDQVRIAYIPTHIPKHFEHLPIKVVVCCGGELQQNVSVDWEGYCRKYGEDRVVWGLWNGDVLADLASKHLLNEYLLPSEPRRLLRKSIALIDEPDKGFLAFTKLLEHLRPPEHASLEKKARAIRTAHCSLRVIHGWGQQEGNLSLSYQGSERMLLWTWSIVKQHQLSTRAGSTRLGECFSRVLGTMLQIGGDYFQKIAPHCLVEDGLSCRSANSHEAALFVFDTIGKLAVIGHLELYLGLITKQDEHLGNANAAANVLSALIQKHAISSTPCYDGQMIDIALALCLLTATGFQSVAKHWITRVVGGVLYAYGNTLHFPIASDRFEDLLVLQANPKMMKPELSHLSTLLPMLADWCLLLGEKESYERIRDEATDVLSAPNFETWYPDESTEKVLYEKQATYDSGVTDCFHRFPAETAEYATSIRAIHKKLPKPDNISCVKSGLPFLADIASRHFRTPVFPYGWQEQLLKLIDPRPSSTEKDKKGSS